MVPGNCPVVGRPERSGDCNRESAWLAAREQKRAGTLEAKVVLVQGQPCESFSICSRNLIAWSAMCLCSCSADSNSLMAFSRAS